MIENSKIIWKSLFIWAATIPLAIINGGIRELILIPVLGNAGFPFSGILLSAMVFAMAFRFLPRLGTGTANTYIKMGFLWVLCTLVFETLLGLLSGDSWAVILNNYNFLSGNLWVFVVLFIGAAPYLAAKARHIV